MATRQILVDRPPEEVWAVLADGYSYVDWVVGTGQIRDVDEMWPEVGSSIHFTVGRPPLTIHDRTTVQLADPGRRLEMEAHAPPLGTARVVVELVPWGGRTVVVLDEHPLTGIGARLHSAFMEVLLHQRNRRMLRNLGRVVAERAPGGPAPTPTVSPARSS